MSHGTRDVTAATICIFNSLYFWFYPSNFLLTTGFSPFPDEHIGITLDTHLKKSFLQYSLPSREKHFSVNVHLQSQHWTHLMCHGLSSTLSRNLSTIGFSQLAHWSMVRTGGIPEPVRGLDALSLSPTSQATRLCTIHEIQRVQRNFSNHITERAAKCSSSVPRDNNPHVAGGSGVTGRTVKTDDHTASLKAGITAGPCGRSWQTCARYILQKKINKGGGTTTRRYHSLVICVQFSV